MSRDSVTRVTRNPLRRALAPRALAYAEYYNTDRTHLALAKDTPDVRPVERSGRIASRPILGGLHHRYYRIAKI